MKKFLLLNLFSKVFSWISIKEQSKTCWLFLPFCLILTCMYVQSGLIHCFLYFSFNLNAYSKIHLCSNLVIWMVAQA